MAQNQRLIHEAVGAAVNYAFHSGDGNWNRGSDCQLLKKSISTVFNRVGLLFLFLFGFIFSIPNNMNENNAPIILSFCAFFTLGPLFLGRLFGRWYFKIREEDVFCRGHLGRRKHCSVSELSGYTFGRNGGAILYKDHKKFFVLDENSDYFVALQALALHGVPCIQETIDTFTMGAEPGYIGILIALTIIPVLFFGWLGCAVGSGWTVFAAAALALYFGAMIDGMCSQRIKVMRDRIECRIWRGEKVVIPFDKVKKVTTSFHKNETYYSFYLEGQEGKPINIPVKIYFNDRRTLDLLISKKGWFPEAE